MHCSTYCCFFLPILNPVNVVPFLPSPHCLLPPFSSSCLFSFSLSSFICIFFLLLPSSCTGTCLKRARHARKTCIVYIKVFWLIALSHQTACSRSSKARHLTGGALRSRLTCGAGAGTVLARPERSGHPDLSMVAAPLVASPRRAQAPQPAPFRRY